MIKITRKHYVLTMHTPAKGYSETIVIDEQSLSSITSFDDLVKDIVDELRDELENAQGIYECTLKYKNETITYKYVN